MELRILGPFEVCDDSGHKVALPTGRERALLAALLLRRGEAVSVDALVEALWGDEAPSTAVKAVQGYVSRLRRMLETIPGARGALVTQPPGYLLRISDDDVDARRFESLAARGWRNLEDHPEAALATFGEALALWRGPALADFAYAEFAQNEIRRLEELRLETVEGRFEAMLRLGRHEAVVAELEQRVAEHPLRERLRGQLMLALYRGGRQAEALEVYRHGRRLLADELGLEPGRELQELERAILAQDPALDVATSRERTPAGATHRAADARSRRGRRSLAMLLASLAVAAGAGTLAYVLVAEESPAVAAIAPPALLAVDPDSNRVVATIEVGSRPTTVAAGMGGIWVGDTRDGTVTRVDPESREVVKTIGIGAPIVDLAIGAGAVWAATGSFGEVVRIDPAVDSVTLRAPLGDPEDPVVPQATSIGVGDGRVWVGAFEGLARLDPSSGEVVDTVDLGIGNALQIAAGEGAVWATTFDSRAKRVEASSGRETAEFYAGGWVDPVVFGGGAVWVGGLNGVSKLDPVTGTELLSARPFGDVLGIAYGAGSLWVSSYSSGEVARLDPETGAVESLVAIGAPGVEAVFSDGLVWFVVIAPQ